ncbi:MAG: adenine deaminase [Oscillospiraceae bacterium]|nr:adenine deaminase [Oscillospiraceae bacterium]
MSKPNVYISTAMGHTEPDLILKNGSVIDVFTGGVRKADVAIKDGIICGVGTYSGKNETDVSGKYIMPGFVDAHVHIESSMTAPGEYAKAVMPHGITTVIADPHEITNVCGEDGLSFMKESSEKVPLDINLMLPSCVPAAPFEHSGAVLTAEDTKRLAPEFFGIGEMMNYPGILSCDSETLGKLCSDIIDGHAPLLSGRELDAYICAGIKTDHECGIVEEMTEKISKGMYVLLREGTLSLDVARLIGGVTPHTLRRCAFCTDDRFIGEIIRDGSIDHCIRKSVSLGLDAVDAIIMATLNACEMYGMKNKGAVAPSYIADLVVADDISLGSIARVYKNGVLVCENGTALFDCETADASKVTRTVHLPKISPDFFADNPPDVITAIELVPKSIATKKVTVNKSDKLSKVCVIERHHNTGCKGIGYVVGYGIENGAVAASIGHDSHNVIVIGDNDADMALAVNALGNSGGIAVCSDGKILSFMELGIAGLMSSKSAAEVTKEHNALYAAAKTLNITDKIDPFLSLSFLPLPVIPEIRITDSGLFDVTEFKFIQ